jgi:hypothetical protein
MAINLPSIGFRLTGAEAGAQPDYQDAIQKGFKTNLAAGQTAYAPKILAENLLASQLKNKLSGITAQYAEPLALAALKAREAQSSLLPLKEKLLQSQIDLTNAKSNSPFGGRNPSGIIGQSFLLNQIKEKYGEESPYYKEAKEAYDIEKDKAKVLNSYRENLSKTADKRASTGIGKLELELVDVEQGFLPGSNRTIQLTPEEQEELIGKYKLKIQNEATDAFTRKSSLFASNIHKTLDMINVNHLVKFGGLQGGIAKKINEGLALTGNETQAYRDFQAALVGAKTLAKQVRQFYGDSITPQIQEALATLTNPSSWINNPGISKNNFLQFKKILEAETSTYKNALKNTKEYEQNNVTNDNYSAGKVIEKTGKNGKKYTFLNGEWYET